MAYSGILTRPVYYKDRSWNGSAAKGEGRVGQRERRRKGPNGGTERTRRPSR